MQLELVDRAVREQNVEKARKGKKRMRAVVTLIEGGASLNKILIEPGVGDIVDDETT